MPEQDKNAQAHTATGNSGTAQAGNKEQLNQMRQQLGTEILSLKKQVLMIQMQSLKTMRQTVDIFFRKQAEETQQYMVQQQQEIQHEAAVVMNEAEKQAGIPPGTKAGKGKKSTGRQEPSHKKASLHAIEEARKSVDNAIKAANKSINKAEQIIKKDIG